MCAEQSHDSLGCEPAKQTARSPLRNDTGEQRACKDKGLIKMLVVYEHTRS